MRLFLFCLFLVSVSVRSAVLDEAVLPETGVVRPERQEGDDVPSDCCKVRWTPCWWFALVHCYVGEWVLQSFESPCAPLFKYYDCCGRCECKDEKGACHIKNKPDQSRFHPPGG